jgi:hypothetical protein
VDVRLRRALTAPLVLAVALAAGAGAASASPLETAPRCQILPRTNVWNKRVDALPLHPRSDEIVAAIGADDYVHADFGSGLWNGGPIGIPVTVVAKSQRRVPVRFRYADESDRGPYPIPRAVRIEGGPRATGDRHALIVNRSTCKLYELFALRKRNGRWHAGSGAIFDLRSNKLRPRGWTSADAAGLPILPGLARYSEVRKGVIDHALRFTVERTRNAYVYPARHQASDLTDPDLPPMGMRFRLRADFPVRPRLGLRGRGHERPPERLSPGRRGRGEPRPYDVPRRPAEACGAASNTLLRVLGPPARRGAGLRR